MALIQLDFYSKSLSKVTQVQVLLPNDMPEEMIKDNAHFKRPIKILYLLHGFSGACKDWLFGSNIQELSGKYNLAVVMMNGDNSFYLNAKGKGKAYQTFTGEELPAYINKVFGFSGERENTFIGGLSMGGFGALHTGFAYPEVFSRVAALSSALVIHDIENLPENFSDIIADYDYYISVFGDLTKLADSENNPEYLYKKDKNEKKELPSIYMACGKEDFLIEQNRCFYKFLSDENADVTYLEDRGIHDWTFWNRFLEPSIKWMLDLKE